MRHMTEGTALVVTRGWRLRMAMERAGITRNGMAALLGVHPTTITRWTHDEGEPPRLIYMERWAEITGVDLDLLTGPDVELDPQMRGQTGGRASTATVQPMRRRRGDITPEVRGITHEDGALIAA